MSTTFTTVKGVRSVTNVSWNINNIITKSYHSFNTALCIISLIIINNNTALSCSLFLATISAYELNL